MKLKMLLLSLLIFLCGCNSKWDYATKIEPEILGTEGSTISIQYILNDFTMLADLNLESKAKVLFIKKNEKELEWKIKIHRSSEDLSSTITYYANDAEIFSERFQNKKVLNHIEKISDKLENFVWNKTYKPKTNTVDEPNNIPQIDNEPKGKL